MFAALAKLAHTGDPKHCVIVLTASREIAEAAMISMIQTLVDKGYAYEKNGTVYYRTRKFEGYGKLSIKTINQDYVSMARVRGIPKKRVQFCYVMRNALIPVFTVFMLDLGYILSGSVVVETVFSYPGLGSLMFQAVSGRDYPLMQYSFLVVSIMVIVMSFLADMLYKKIDPGLGVRNEK